MSAFIDSTPTLRVEVENVFLNKRYPSSGHAIAVLDTGFSGFLGVPADVFDELDLGALDTQAGEVVVANGERVASRGTYGRLKIRQASAAVSGFVQTWQGLDEILVGNQALKAFRLDIDYCLRRLAVQKCGNLAPPED